MAAGRHILTSKSAWLRICILTQAERTERTENGQANMQRQAQKRIHMDAQANTHAVRRVYTDISSHTNTYTTTQTHTPLSAVFIRSVSVLQE